MREGATDATDGAVASPMWLVITPKPGIANAAHGEALDSRRIPPRGTRRPSKRSQRSSTRESMS